MSLNPITLAEPPRPPIKWQLGVAAGEVVEAPTLDPSQQAVVDHRAGAMLVLAGPGTGKTTTLTEAVTARLIGEDALDPEQVLVLTFARKAATEIRDRIMARRGGGIIPAVSTFHSLALSLVREFDPEAAGEIRLLSGPEQEVVVREILQGLIDEQIVANTVAWPADLAAAIGKRGLTVEVRNAMARARGLGLGPEEVLKISAAAQDHNWMAVAGLLDQYLEAVEMQAAVDYNELIFRAVQLTRSEPAASIVKARYRAVFVDEYQDTDPMQIALLQNLVAPDTSLIAVGDPDQSIYGFRGADASAIKKFSEHFSYITPGEAPRIHALTNTRRFGPTIRDAAYRVIARNSVTEFPSSVARSHRDLHTDPARSGEVVIRHYESSEVEAEEIAEQIRHLVLRSRQAESGQTPMKWSDVAVLVRAGTTSIPILERACIQAGVPVVTKFEDVALASEPAVAVLLRALEVALAPQKLAIADNAIELITSPLGGLDASEVRRLGRALRDWDRASTFEPRWSEDLIATALADAKFTVNFDTTVISEIWLKFESLRNLLADAHAMVQSGKGVEAVLWHIWSNSSWRDRLRNRALSGARNASRAHRDLDAVITLFELAAASQTKAHTSRNITTFVSHIRSLTIPAQSLPQTYQPDAVSLMTAHAAKGLEWRAVFICGADEEVWPDIRRRSSIFQPERLTLDELGNLPERHVVLAEERRLFFVACTRARDYLHVSSTAADPESGRLPSRFIKQLAGDVVAENTELESGASIPTAPEDLSPARYSINSLVSLLRRTAADSTKSAEHREAAEIRLAHLAQLKDADGRLLVPSAHPASWWGLAEVTETETPIDDPAQPVFVRGSSLERIHQCSLSWFMEQRVHADEPTTSALSFGLIVHALAEAVGLGELEPELGAMQQHLDHIWPMMRYEAPWRSEQERLTALGCIQRFLLWRKDRTRTLLGVEQRFDGQWPVTGANGYSDVVTLRGTIDIVEVDDSNGIFIADLKTSKTPPSFEKAKEHMQLGLYQAAVKAGLLDGLRDRFPDPSAPSHPDGAELVMIRNDDGSKPTPAVRPQPALVEDPETGALWIEHRLAEAAEIVRSEKYIPTLGEGCALCRIKNACPLQAQGKPVIS